MKPWAELMGFVVHNLGKTVQQLLQDIFLTNYIYSVYIATKREKRDCANELLKKFLTQIVSHCVTAEFR